MAKLRGLEGLAHYRQRAGLTQQGLADTLHMSRSTVTMWENGLAWPSAALLPTLADVLLCSIDDLYVNPTKGEEVSQCSRAIPICTEGTDALPV